MPQPRPHLNGQHLKPGPPSAINAQHRSMGWLLLAIVLLLSTMFAQQSRAAEFEIDDPGSGVLYLTSDTASFKPAFQPAVHLTTDVVMDIKGLNAAVIVEQSFTNATDEWVEGVYVFPLPENSAINFMQMKVGDRLLKGKIQEKEQAQHIYNEAKNAGKKAALVQQERPNLFTQSIANIAPGETVSVELRYLQAVDFDQGVFSIRYPMTLTPRYIPGQPLAAFEKEQQLTVSGNGWAQPTSQVPDADRITPFYLPGTRDGAAQNPISLQVTIEAGLPLANIHSSSHALDLQQPADANDLTRVARLIGDTGMDRDFVLEWRPASSNSAHAALFHEKNDDGSFVQLMLLPPQIETGAQVLQRELILVVDTSGSMQGPSIQQARESVLWALDQLKPVDHFNIIAFDSFHTELFAAPVEANARNLRHAKTFVRQLHASGGTEMASALEAALSYPASEERLKQVVFITDGSVGNETALFALIDAKLQGARLFTVGIGSAPNSYFMRKAAEFGRGSFTYIGDTQQVKEKMSGLFRKLGNPVMAGITIDWPGTLTPEDIEMFPPSIPDLYLGEPLLITARIANGLPASTDITITGKSGLDTWQRKLILPETESRSAYSSTTDKIIATQWARQKIGALLDDKIKGRDAAEVREEVLKVALPYQLLSPYTSFVAVEESIFRTDDKPLHSKRVHNQLPAGQTAPALMYPQTATSASLNMLLALLAACLLWVIRRGLNDA